MRPPWGLGGVLQVEADLVEYLASSLKEADLERVGLQLGDPAGQQVWESRGVLAALRLWASRWQNRRVRRTVIGDSIAMHTTVLHMKADSQNLGLIAREGVLDTAESAFEPDIGVHIPGIANDLADALSRKTAPTQTMWRLPSPLRHAKVVFAPLRDDLFYRTL